jgi:hypothetical protein
MSAIYRRAEITVAWLGRAYHSTFAFATLRTLEGSMDDDPGILSLIDEESHSALIDLMEREYWRRIWITQEIALSQDVLIMCGSHSIAWSSLELAFKKVSKHTVPGNSVWTIKTEGFRHIAKLQQFRGDATADTPVHFFNALYRTRASLASDVRDKAFAILGLSYNGSAFVTVPDYSQSVSDLCLEITMSAITLYRSLDVIIFLTHWDEPGERPLRRSWIVNWLDCLPLHERPYHYLTGEAQFVLDITRGSIADQYLDSVSRGRKKRPTTRSKWRASLKAKYLFNFDRGCLNVKGIIFDSLTGLSSTNSGLPGSTSSDVTPELQNVYSINISSSSLFVEERLTKFDASVLAVLFYLLLYMHPFGLIKGGYTNYVFERSLQFSKCWPPVTPEYPEHDTQCNRRVWTWFEQNQSFVILGKTLDQWMRLIPPTPISPSLEAVDVVLQWNMRLSVTQKGYLGWTVERARAGDSIAILLGCSVPVILRPGPDGGWYVVGDAIIYGIMDGEAFADLPPVDDWGYLTLHE